MAQRLTELDVENFRSLRKVSLPLGPVNVLVGPNGAGKTNVLKVFDFLADIVRTDLGPALDGRGGFEQLIFRGSACEPSHIQIGLKGYWSAPTEPEAVPDLYRLKIIGSPLAREEVFHLTRAGGWRNRITVSGRRASSSQYGADATPEQSGVVTHGRRRVRGLRREEVAMLAGVSTDYYSR